MKLVDFVFDGSFEGSAKLVVRIDAHGYDAGGGHSIKAIYLKVGGGRKEHTARHFHGMANNH